MIGAVKDAVPGPLVIDVTEVKGTPKGLMRAVVDDSGKTAWFYAATVGKHKYAAIVVGIKSNPQFGKEGEFAEWKKAKVKQYLLVKYTVDGDKLVIDGGDWTALRNEDINNYEVQGDHYRILIYDPPAGWLNKYLDKTGPDKIFDGKNFQAFSWREEVVRRGGASRRRPAPARASSPNLSPATRAVPAVPGRAPSPGAVRRCREPESPSARAARHAPHVQSVPVLHPNRRIRFAHEERIPPFGSIDREPAEVGHQRRQIESAESGVAGREHRHTALTGRQQLHVGQTVRQERVERGA